MIQSELSAVSDEIAVIRQAAFDAGYKAANDDLQRRIKEANEASDTVEKRRIEWRQVVHDIKFSYGKQNPGKQFRSLYDISDSYSSRSAAASLPYPLPEEEELFCSELARLVRMGKDFELMLKGIEDNEIIKVQWNRLLVAMRMNQRD
jgi:hypothetical protein